MAELVNVINRIGENSTSNLSSLDVDSHVAGIRRSAVLSHSTLNNFDRQV